MIKIGNTILRHGLLLAPMAGYTDRAFRRVAHECGAEWLVTEMVSAKATVYKDKKTAVLGRIMSDEGNVALQIFGKEPEIMAEAAAILSLGFGEGYARPAAIDINMGCPVHKIFSNGEGSALMRDPELIYKIVKSVSSSSDLPTTVKLRIGVDEKHINAKECALAAEEGGAALICMHGRTRVQMYSGEVDLETIAKVKEDLHIPLIANGDITSLESALHALRVTSADGIAIGRGAVGNPFVFSEIKAMLEGEEYTPPTPRERAETALYQLRLACLDKGEKVAVSEARKQIASYFRDGYGVAKLRAKINLAATYEEVEGIIYDYLEHYN